MSLVWTESLKTGIPEIDQQHKQMMDQMNLLYDAISKNQGEQEIRKILSFLNLYTKQHFGFEEQCMHRYNCPIRDQNKTAHAHFIAALKEVEIELNTQGVSTNLAIKINQKLLEWFANHIKKIDTQLKGSIMN